MAREVKLTQEGFERLQQQLVIEQQRLADATGILQEQTGSSDDFDDSGIEDAKREKLNIAMRIDELEDTLARAVIITHKEGSKNIELGSIIKLIEEKSGRELEVQLVSGAEATVLGGIRKVSDDSPLGTKLIGKKKNEMFIVDLEKNQLKYKVLEIR
jgi:transcription elongation factor GreA